MECSNCNDCFKNTLSNKQEYKNIDKEFFKADFQDRDHDSDQSAKPSEFGLADQSFLRDADVSHPNALVPANIIQSSGHGRADGSTCASFESFRRSSAFSASHIHSQDTGFVGTRGMP